MEDWSAHYLFQGATKKLGESAAHSLKRYAQNLRRASLPVLFSLGHLSKVSGIEYVQLRKTVERYREAANYRIFSIKKRSGGRRYIHAVTGKLFRVQQFINAEILNRLHPHPTSFAFHSKGGIRACALTHCGARWLFQYDLKDFFYSINEVAAYNVFVKAGYRPLLAFEMARICTTTHLPSELRSYLQPKNSARYYQIYNKSHGVLGVLPQGAPTSPMLSNLAAFNLDVIMTKFADAHGLVYTRYADDLTLSSGTDLPRALSIGDIHRAVIEIIRKSGFRENPKKIRVAGPGSRKIVLGLLVDGPLPRLSRKTYKRIDRLIYSICKYGIYEAAIHEKFDSPMGLYNHVAGLIAFVKDVDFPRWREFHKKFSEIPNPLLRSTT